jgi:hypothetical protein
MLLAGSGGVYVLEDLADVLVVARLQFGAKDVRKTLTTVVVCVSGK